jgi:hypothetical protein
MDGELNPDETGADEIIAELERSIDENLAPVMPDGWDGHDRLAEGGVVELQGVAERLPEGPETVQWIAGNSPDVSKPFPDAGGSRQGAGSVRLACDGRVVGSFHGGSPVSGWAGLVSRTREPRW